MTIFLSTDRLLLRQFTVDDVDRLAELHSDPRMMRYLGHGPVPRAEIEQEMLPKLLAGYAPGRGRWAAVERSSGELVGWLSLRGPTVDELELGFRLRSASWGLGYATEGSRALLRAAFEEHGARRVFAETMAVNLPSRRVLERVGLRYVRTFHKHWDDPLDGNEHGMVEYELFRTAWSIH